MSTYLYSYCVMDSLGLVPIGFVQCVPDKATYVKIKLFLIFGFTKYKMGGYTEILTFVYVIFSAKSYIWEEEGLSFIKFNLSVWVGGGVKM